MANKRRRKRRRTGNWFTRLGVGGKIGVCFGGILVCLIASTVVFVAAKLSKIETETIAKEDIVVNELEEEVGEGYTDFALFGVDSREGDLDIGTRTDCIIVASLNNKTKEVKMVSVYRDSLLDLSEGTMEKCNAAYSYGGPELAISMLNKNLDLSIQDYVTVDFASIADTVDLLGGVEIDVKAEEVQYINEFVYETGQVAKKEAYFVHEPGVQTLDGVQATTYARIRSTAGGDYTRTERQRYVIEKMVDEILKSDLATVNKIVDKVFPKIRTSLSSTEVLSYAKSYSKYRLGENTGFPMYKTDATIPGKGSVVVPVDLEKNVIQLHEFLYEVTDYTPSEAVTKIGNKIYNLAGDLAADTGEIPKVGEYAEDTGTSNQKFDDGIERD